MRLPEALVSGAPSDSRTIEEPSGFASSTGTSLPRFELFVSAAYTRPVTGLRSMSSGRSIFVGETVSAARRVSISTSATLIPSTNDSVAEVSAIHSPVPSYSSSSSPSPVNFATYSVPSSSRPKLCSRAFAELPLRNVCRDTNL